MLVLDVGGAGSGGGAGITGFFNPLRNSIMAKKNTQINEQNVSTPQAEFVDEVVQRCQSSGVKGIDWAALAQQYGPFILQVLLQILQKAQAQGVMAVAPEQEVKCSDEDLKKLDECIDQCCACLCTLSAHRCKCVSK